MDVRYLLLGGWASPQILLGRERGRSPVAGMTARVRQSAPSSSATAPPRKPSEPCAVTPAATGNGVCARAPALRPQKDFDRLRGDHFLPLQFARRPLLFRLSFSYDCKFTPGHGFRSRPSRDQPGISTRTIRDLKRLPALSHNSAVPVENGNVNVHRAGKFRGDDKFREGLKRCLKVC